MSCTNRSFPEVTQPITGLSDAELVALAQRGVRGAFDELVVRHRASLLTLACGILHDWDNAEDVVQDSFMKAFTNIGSFEGKCQFSSWVARIVINCCFMKLRRDRRWRSCGAAVLENLRDLRQHPASDIASRQQADLLSTEVNRLPKLFRDVMVLHDIEERPEREVAASLGVNAGAVKSRLFRARREMRNRVLRHCGPKGLATFLSA